MNSNGTLFICVIKAVIGKRAGIIIVTNSSPYGGIGLNDVGRICRMGRERYFFEMYRARSIEE
jgi:hypothetical protein